MRTAPFNLAGFCNLATPFYFYDTQLLNETIASLLEACSAYSSFEVHYAVKACTNNRVLAHIVKAGLGADCVSGGEVEACLDAGFPARKIVFAGVGKSDWEIVLALRANIGFFNVESAAELDIINKLAARVGNVARICFRINPDVGAHTHRNITTGLAENKFGISMESMEDVIALAGTMRHVRFEGLHFHIGSQITEMDDFAALCDRVNELQDRLEGKGIGPLKHINVGGGLGIDYDNPDERPIPDFKSYFDTFARRLRIRAGQKIHFELGRSVVGQCGSLITRCLYVKEGTRKRFVVVDAGMTDLIRPALYHARHLIQNLSSDASEARYDVVGPICESSDVFATDYWLNETKRGDFIAIRSAGAYGETMASQYNCRRLPTGYCSEDFI